MSPIKIKPPQTILITGANSGLGKALAIGYAAPGINLCLGARDEERLREVAALCRTKGAYVKADTIDVTNKLKMAQWINDCDATFKIDLVIANAGISAGTASHKNNSGESPQQVRDIFAVNMDGVLNTILPTIHKMQGRKSGQIAILSSLASFRGMPSCPAYSASKAAIRAYGEGLRGQLREHHIGVTVVCPGYIKTPMTDVNQFPMPLLMEAEKAAQIIIKKLAKNPARIAFPKRFYWLISFLGFLPPWMTDPLFNRLPKKG